MKGELQQEPPRTRLPERLHLTASLLHDASVMAVA